MQKVSYMGDGSTTEFTFNFPYFENTNIIVTKNSATATGYTIIGTSAGADADIPYTGGKVVFETAPTALDSITIARSLPLTRIADYQPTELIEPTTLNQDLNYLMEVIKDRKDELADLTTKYAEIADKESTDIILARITAIHDEIVDIDAKIRALGDIGTLQQRVTELTTTVGGHTTSINGLDTRTTGMIDYVVESQAPTAENNYTWYRKYKSGWVEQGGTWTGSVTVQSGQETIQEITLPVRMRNNKYFAGATVAELFLFPIGFYRSATTINFRFGTYSVSRTLSNFVWTICGMAE